MANKRERRSDSGYDKRWPIESEMLALGFSVEEVAQHVGVGVDTVRNDLREVGGLVHHFPSRPRAEQDIYVAMFKRYAKESVTNFRTPEDQRVWDELKPPIESKLDVAEIEHRVRGMFDALGALKEPANRPEAEHLMKFVRDVLELPRDRFSRIRHDAEEFFSEFLLNFMRMDVAAPCSKDDFLNGLVDQFRFRVPRENLRGPFNVGFWGAVDEAIKSLPDRHEFIIRRSYGIGIGEMTMRRIASLLGGITYTRVGQIRNEALEMIRGSSHGDALRPFVGDFAWFMRELGAARAETTRLRETIAQLKEFGADVNDRLASSVETLELPSRLHRRLRALGVFVIGELVQCTRKDIALPLVVGDKSLEALESALSAIGLGLDGAGLNKSVLSQYKIPQAVERQREDIADARLVRASNEEKRRRMTYDGGEVVGFIPCSTSKK